MSERKENLFGKIIGSFFSFEGKRRDDDNDGVLEERLKKATTISFSATTGDDRREGIKKGENRNSGGKSGEENDDEYLKSEKGIWDNYRKKGGLKTSAAKWSRGGKVIDSPDS